MKRNSYNLRSQLERKNSISVQLHIQIHRWLIGFRLKCCYAFFVVCCGCCTSYIVLVHIQCQASVYTLSLCRGHSWRVRLAKQETLTPPGYLVSTLVCRGPWMYTVVLYCWCHSDSASVLLYFTLLSINNPDFQNYLSQNYPIELKIKDTTESNTSASYLDLLLSIERDGQLRTSLCDKRDDFNFNITNFPFLGSNIPSSPAYGVLSHSSYGMPGLAPLMNVLF